MMQQPRMWRDTSRLVGLSAWLTLLIPVLALVLAYDQLGVEYTTVRDDHSEITTRLEKALNLSQLAPRYKEKLMVLGPLFATVVAKAYQNEEINASQEAMAQELANVLSAIYVQPDQPIQVVSNSMGESVALLTASIEFKAVPQQMNALELQLLARQGKLTVSELHVQVIPDPQRNSQQLQVSMVVKAIHLTPSLVNSHASNSFVNSKS